MAPPRRACISGLQHRLLTTYQLGETVKQKGNITKAITKFGPVPLGSSASKVLGEQPSKSTVLMSQPYHLNRVGGVRVDPNCLAPPNLPPPSPREPPPAPRPPAAAEHLGPCEGCHEPVPRRRHAGELRLADVAGLVPRETSRGQAWGNAWGKRSFKKEKEEKG